MGEILNQEIPYTGKGAILHKGILYTGGGGIELELVEKFILTQNQSKNITITDDNYLLISCGHYNDTAYRVAVWEIKNKNLQQIVQCNGAIYVDISISGNTLTIAKNYTNATNETILLRYK